LLSLRTYVQGVFSDSDRKSPLAMLARVTEPVSYQAFQHFIPHAPWDADRVWQLLRAVFPTRPRLVEPARNRRGRPRIRRSMAAAVHDCAVQVPHGQWRRITWRNGTQQSATANLTKSIWPRARDQSLLETAARVPNASP